jgi:hypothetical protein
MEAEKLKHIRSAIRYMEVEAGTCPKCGGDSHPIALVIGGITANHDEDCGIKKAIDMITEELYARYASHMVVS